MADDEKPIKRLKWLEPNYDRAKRSKKHENRLADRLGGQRLPRSGAKKFSDKHLRAQTSLTETPDLITENGDLVLPDYWVEHKRTDTGTMSIKKAWWQKLKEGAAAADRTPALIVTFEEPNSPSAKPIDLVLLPLEVFERLRKKA